MAKKTDAKHAHLLPTEDEKVVKVICDHCQTLSSHSLRRSAATLVARTGASAMQVAEFGRWSDPRTVQRTYLQDNAQERIKLAQRTFVGG